MLPTLQSAPKETREIVMDIVSQHTGIDLKAGLSFQEPDSISSGEGWAKATVLQETGTNGLDTLDF